MQTGPGDVAARGGNASGGPPVVRAAATRADIDAFAALCRDYADSLAHTAECRSLEHQQFAAELASLPGAYAPPRGEILIAFDGAKPIGCVAIRPLDTGDSGPARCEMKRMYVHPAHRGRGVGRLLAQASLAAARRIGYHAMRLDTGESMTAAAALYQSLGFTDIPAYNADPVPGTRWMELRLT
ncbi:MAG: GNAT family N-acetyltransferase [Phycisphaeraceae bacterium]|nr:GNAT family N-acetyltransferase [Phycisphaeraceae bacterium]